MGVIAIVGILLFAWALKYFSPVETCVRESVNLARAQGLGLYVDDLSQIEQTARIYCSNN